MTPAPNPAHTARAIKLFGPTPWCEISVQGRARHDECCDDTREKMRAAHRAAA